MTIGELIIELGKFNLGSRVFLTKSFGTGETKLIVETHSGGFAAIYEGDGDALGRGTAARWIEIEIPSER